MYAYMNAKHVNYSTTSPNKFTAYKTIASLPCTVARDASSDFITAGRGTATLTYSVSVRVLLICES